ncbi:MAG: hypothetical protein IGBAC_0614 [Ignavibacteriae bacterium]|nr:MAG: hypothetical protein IGBAC_0614 [Ignavibacteriota bacterium]
MEKVFKYKLDFYYQQSIIYLITLILYAGFRGSFIEDEFSLVFKDPILYIILIFVIGSFIVLILNLIRDRKLIVQDDKIIFYNRFNRREINISDIEWIYIGVERSVKTAGRSQAIVIKIKGRLRLYRIRLGRYEHQKELMHLLNEIAKKVPQKKKLRERIKDKF